MYKYEEIKSVHLEITERCQAGCPMCGRFDLSGSVNHNVTNATMSYDDSVKIFSPRFISQLEHMYMCGNFGDPIMAPDTLSIFERFRDFNFRIKLFMYTNGGARPKEWWRELANILTPETKSKVVFAIDGLEDTNHIYRRNVKWSKVMESVEAYIGAGGEAEWHYLVFKHNEHQIDEAELLSRKLGFKKFRLKKSSRFWAGSNSRNFMGLYPPEDQRYVNDKSQFMATVNQRYGSYDNFLDKTPIKCMVKDDKSLYVSAKGELFPCCWLAYEPYSHDMKSPNDSSVFKYIKNVDDINAIKKPMEDIFASGYFDEIEKSWELGSVAEGKVKTCAKTCSLNNFFKGQFND